jgi:hypothetical protein
MVRFIMMQDIANTSLGSLSFVIGGNDNYHEMGPESFAAVSKIDLFDFFFIQRIETASGFTLRNQGRS